VPKNVEAGAALANCRALINQIDAGLSAEKPLVDVSSAAELLFYLEFAASCSHKVRTTASVGLTTNERDFPYLVELKVALPPKGFRSVFLEIDAFHRERRIPVRRGRSRQTRSTNFYIRFCFPDAATADAFRNRFGGECLTHASGKPKPRTSATSSAALAVKREAEEDWGR
jgi:hypothetical protein